MKYELLINYLKEKEIVYIEKYPTWRATSFETGSTVDIAIFPHTSALFCEILSLLHTQKIKFFIVGEGTNTFFSDNMLEGALIFTSYLNKISIDNDVMSAECGAKITDCSVVASINGLAGLEFACGIPGSVGGAVFMNCSAFEKSISDVILCAEVYDISLKKRFSMSCKEQEFNLKDSIFSKNKNLVLIKSSFILKKHPSKEITDLNISYVKKRLLSQPLEWGSCGSAFKRPKNGYASRLIDSAGLKGLKCGGAQVSSKHAGFVINYANATSRDVCELLSKIKSRVYEQFATLLEEEIIYVSE